MDKAFVNSVYSALCEVAEERTNELQKYKSARVFNDPDDEQDPSHPIYDAFLDFIKPTELHKMTILSPTEIEIYFDYIEPFLTPVWNRGRGNRCN